MYVSVGTISWEYVVSSYAHEYSSRVQSYRTAMPGIKMTGEHWGKFKKQWKLLKEKRETTKKQIETKALWCLFSLYQSKDIFRRNTRIVKPRFKLKVTSTPKSPCQKATEMQWRCVKYWISQYHLAIGFVCISSSVFVKYAPWLLTQTNRKIVHPDEPNNKTTKSL